MSIKIQILKWDSKFLFNLNYNGKKTNLIKIVILIIIIKICVINIKNDDILFFPHFQKILVLLR